MNRPIRSVDLNDRANCCNMLDQRLKSLLKGNYEKFVDFLIKNQGVISGSFILQTILKEDWYNSDIDIYIGVGGEEQTLAPKIFLDCQPINVVHSNYLSAMSDILMVCDYDINDSIDIQIVYIDLTKTKDLWTHVGLTGFEACKNMFYYSQNRNPLLRVTNLWEIVNKRTTFSILDSKDFFYRIEKYTKRDFSFKPKYNKLLFLEYLILKYTPLIIKVDKNYQYVKSKNHQICPEICPIKLLYPYLRHYHTTYDNYCRDIGYGGTKLIVINDKNGELAYFNPRMKNPNGLLMMIGEPEISNCENTTEYAKIRNNLVPPDFRIDVKNKENRYNIRFRLPKSDRPNKRNRHLNIVQEHQKTTEKEDFPVIGKVKTKPPPNPIDPNMTWAERIKKAIGNS